LESLEKQQIRLITCGHLSQSVFATSLARRPAQLNDVGGFSNFAGYFGFPRPMHFHEVIYELFRQISLKHAWELSPCPCSQKEVVILILCCDRCEAGQSYMLKYIHTINYNFYRYLCFNLLSMKYIYTICLCCLFLCTFESQAQTKSKEGYFLVELEKFAPPVQDMIKTFEGFPATPFMANDMNGVERFLGDFKGKPAVLFFWNTASSDAVSMLYEFNQLKKKFGKKVSIIAMADESREDVTKFLGSTGKMDIIIIPNTRMLSEAVYGVELGYPRVFMIDDTGVIRSVIPQQYFESHGDHKGLLEGAIQTYLK
jgi:peroxiredoxin